MRGDVIFFYDDDAFLPTDDVVARLVDVLEEDPRVGAVQPRPVDPDGRPSPGRWVPRPGGRDPLRPGRGRPGCGRAPSPSAATPSSGAGGWPGHFFYGHEGIELIWRVWDQGYVGVVRARTIVVNHPATSPTRHAVYWRMNARNRVWVARRNLPWPLVAPYLLTWVLVTLLRVRSRAGAARLVRRLPRGTRPRRRASGARCRGAPCGG